MFVSVYICRLRVFFGAVSCAGFVSHVHQSWFIMCVVDSVDMLELTGTHKRAKPYAKYRSTVRLVAIDTWCNALLVTQMMMYWSQCSVKTGVRKTGTSTASHIPHTRRAARTRDAKQAADIGRRAC